MPTPNNNYPEIRIIQGRLLQSAFVRYLKKDPKYRGKKELSAELRTKIVRSRVRSWKRSEKKIILGMRKITGLDFYKKVIDVYIVFGFDSTFSEPLVMSAKFQGNDYIDVLTHELIHNILTDNTSKVNSSSWVKRRFPKIKDRTAIVHILVHAVHEAIYRDVLKSPQRLSNDIEKCQKSPGYRLAWDIVKKEGYKNLIRDFKKGNKLG